MSKNVTSVCLDPEVTKHLKNMRKKYKFNFSEWLNRKYASEFMGETVKQKEIAKHKQQIVTLEKEITEINEREQTYVNMLSRPEKRFLGQVKRLISEGKDWLALNNRFNISFNRSFGLAEFKKMVEVIYESNKKTK